MEGRKSLLWACSFLLCAGCLTTGTTKTAPVAKPTPPAAPASTVRIPTASASPLADTPASKDPKSAPRLIIAFAKLKESEAKAADRDPERQFKLRDETRQLYQEAAKLDAGNLDAHRGLGRIYVDLGEFERAHETFTKAIAKFPKESIFWYELGQMHNRKKEFPQAVGCFRKALELDPENRLYTTTLGFTLARAGQTDQAVTLLTHSMGAASAQYNVARMLLHLQRSEEGLQHLRRAVQTNPNLENARTLLSDLESGNARVNVSLEFQAIE